MNTTSNDSVLYGDSWDSAHQGYFSDPDVAAPFIDTLEDVFKRSAPDVVADLGGGTGVVIRGLIERLGEAAAGHVIVDTSSEQLGQVCDRRIKCVHSPVEKLERSMLVSGKGSLLLCMRSLLHYFGKDGLRPILKHLRSLLEEGEYLVHQTVCFAEKEEGIIANELYDFMGTGKWFTSLEELTRALNEEQFEVMDFQRAPSLVIRKSELEERYNADGNSMGKLAESLRSEYGEREGLFECGAKGFTTYLHYYIFVCKAA